MSLVISLGSNIGNRIVNLNAATIQLNELLIPIGSSHIYTSKAEGLSNQPDFYNQVLEFETPSHLTPKELLQHTMRIEKKLGRKRLVKNGPRTIDIDILFWDTVEVNTEDLTIPHPRLFNRSFVVKPLMELNCFKELAKHYSFAKQFSLDAFPLG